MAAGKGISLYPFEPVSEAAEEALLSEDLQAPCSAGGSG